MKPSEAIFRWYYTVQGMVIVVHPPKFIIPGQRIILFYPMKCVGYNYLILLIVLGWCDSIYFTN